MLIEMPLELIVLCDYSLFSRLRICLTKVKRIVGIFLLLVNKHNHFVHSPGK